MGRNTTLPVPPHLENALDRAEAKKQRVVHMSNLYFGKGACDRAHQMSGEDDFLRVDEPAFRII